MVNFNLTTQTKVKFDCFEDGNSFAGWGWEGGDFDDDNQCDVKIIEFFNNN